MLSKRLKEETKEPHLALEKLIIRHIKDISEPAQYIALLKLFYGYYKPVEEHLDRYFNDEIIPFYSDRRKAATILEDLSNLGNDNIVLPLALDTPVIDSTAKAFGSFYVLEGSTLGGSIIADMLIKHAGINTGNTRFFNVYAENKEMMWQTFKEKMDNWNETANSDEEVITAAATTFSKFKKWIEEN